MAKNVISSSFSEPLDGVTAAKLEFDAGDGNLMIDQLVGGEPVLAAGAVEVVEGEEPPARTRVTSNGQSTFALKRKEKGRAWFHLPWKSCNGATTWRIHMNPTVSSDIAAHCDGGNVLLNLAGMAVRSVSADTGGGNVGVVLPNGVDALRVAAGSGAGNVSVEIGDRTTGSNTVTASSGAGNVDVHVPGDIAARIVSTAGMGKVTVAARFVNTGNNTYQSPDFESAANKVEITVKSGMGNITVAST